MERVPLLDAIGRDHFVEPNRKSGAGRDRDLIPVGEVAEAVRLCRGASGFRGRYSRSWCCRCRLGSFRCLRRGCRGRNGYSYGS